MALQKDSSMKTCLKFWILAFDNRIEDKYEKKITIVLFAENEKTAIKKAEKIALRKTYEVYEVVEVADSIV